MSLFFFKQPKDLRIISMISLSFLQNLNAYYNSLLFKNISFFPIFFLLPRLSMSSMRTINNAFFFSDRLNFYFSKYYYLGLGYKMYVIRGVLFVWVGLTHYTLLKLPPFVKVFAKKKRIFIVSHDKAAFKCVMHCVRSIKKKDLYKGKGILEVKSYKNFLKMKTGKKKQY